MAKFAFVVCLLLVGLIHTGHALKCYACDSKTKANCNDPFVKDDIPLNDCQAASSTMDATCIKLASEDNGMTNTRRYCLAFPKNSKPCDYATAQLKIGNVKECQTCMEDGCNAAGSLGASAYAIMVTCVLAVLNLFIKA